jgi:hypothetical protein
MEEYSFSFVTSLFNTYCVLTPTTNLISSHFIHLLETKYIKLIILISFDFLCDVLHCLHFRHKGAWLCKIFMTYFI